MFGWAETIVIVLRDQLHHSWRGEIANYHTCFRPILATWDIAEILGKWEQPGIRVTSIYSRLRVAAKKFGHRVASILRV